MRYWPLQVLLLQSLSLLPSCYNRYVFSVHGSVSFLEKFDATATSKSLKVVEALSSNREHNGTG
jgi:hypothetical protein